VEALQQLLFPPRPTVEQFFKKATDCNQVELPDYWRWGGWRAEAMWDVDHDADPEVAFRTRVGLRCARPWAALRAHLIAMKPDVPPYMRGSVSGYFEAPCEWLKIHYGGWAYSAPCHGIPAGLAFIVRDETAGVDYTVDSISGACIGFRAFRFSWSWALLRGHEYTMRFEARSYHKRWGHLYRCDWTGHKTARLGLWVEQISVDTNAYLIVK